ncbi:MAG: SLBB domain-containing protein [Paludibacteraceae bacterium]|nr:SLBB domain-containing protein [Paludibacteraceae bacterium]
MANISSVKVDNLSDAQIEAFVDKYTKAGYSFADVERIAVERGMPADELEKLKVRIQSASVEQKPVEKVSEVEKIDNEAKIEQNQDRKEQRILSREANSVFGSYLFTNSNMSFEPNSNMPTPRSYQVGPGDELVVDVFGMSETTMRLTVSREGVVRIPNVGQVQVAGMSIEDAEKKIKKQLTTVYSTISSGRTTVTVSLGNIRSINVYVVGEATRPGTYTLSSLSSVFNALYACGGPSSRTGSMRNIKVLRSGVEIASVDIYGFLTKGVLENNITLQNQDVIYIPAYKSRVSIKGELKHNGIFEIKDGESLEDLITYCGGFTDDAYTERISVVRYAGNEKSVEDVEKSKFSYFRPKAGDEYTVGSILNRFANRVQISGCVFRPGTYALTEGMTLKDLVEKADGLKEDAYMQHATILRLKEDLKPEMIAFNVQDLISGAYNIELKKEDIVTIGSNDEFERDKQVSIRGRVLAPGKFPYFENMTLKDLIFMAKGFSDFADKDRIEITRRVTDPETLKEDLKKKEVFVLSLSDSLQQAATDFVLYPRDEVSVRGLQGFEDLSSVQVVGEFASPGYYAILSKDEKISDVIKRAGGFSPHAEKASGFLLRKTNRSHIEYMRDLKMIRTLSNMQDEEERIRYQNSLLGRLDMLAIDLEEIEKKPGSKTDLYLQEGDVIYVPKPIQTVTVSGAVHVPGMVIYDSKSLKKYVSSAGGFTNTAVKKHSYVAYADGSIAATKRFLWIKKYPKIKTGAHIYIPEEVEENKETHVKENVAIFTAIASCLASISTGIVYCVIAWRNN